MTYDTRPRALVDMIIVDSTDLRILELLTDANESVRLGLEVTRKALDKQRDRLMAGDQA